MQFPANLAIDMVIISDPQLKKRRTSQRGQEGVVSSAGGELASHLAAPVLSFDKNRQSKRLPPTCPPELLLLSPCNPWSPLPGFGAIS